MQVCAIIRVRLTTGIEFGPVVLRFGEPYSTLDGLGRAWAVVRALLRSRMPKTCVLHIEEFFAMSNNFLRFGIPKAVVLFSVSVKVEGSFPMF